ncbi:MAG: ATP-binding protein [Planctomycetota bacterium]
MEHDSDQRRFGWIFSAASGATVPAELWDGLLADLGDSCWLPLLHPCDAVTVRTELHRACAGLSPQCSRELVARLRTSGTQISPGYTWFRVGLCAAGDGTVSGTLQPVEGNSADLDHLASRVDLLSALLSAVPECFKIVDQDARLVDMNHAGLSIVQTDDLDSLRGASVLDLVMPEHKEEYLDGLRRSLAGERIVQQFQIRGLQGSERWMEQVAAALPPPDGSETPTMMGAFTRDITATKLLIQELSAAKVEAEASSRAKSAFLANMSHEIRTPLTAILGFAHMLEDTGLDPEIRRDCIYTIQTSGTHLLKLIEDLLDHSKIEAGTLAVSVSLCDPTQIVEEVVRLSKPAAGEKPVSIAIEPVSGLDGKIATDPVRLKQIVTNLMDNALKFTESGKIALRLSRPAGGGVRIDVKDTGIGISEEGLGKLFEPFSQADDSMSKRFGGSGLGLSISRSLAQELGGDVIAQSTLGEGSCFSAWVADLNTRLESEQQDCGLRTPNQASSLSGRNILVVEDMLDNRRLLRLHLGKRLGANLTEVENGAECVRLFDNEDPGFDLILMDVQMPVLDGQEATRQLRAMGVRTPIIALTAYAVSGASRTCLEAGCDAFISKPIDFEILRAECCRLLTNRHEGGRAA